MAISVTSQLFLTLRNSQSVIKCFGLRYASDIQRLGFNLTVQIFLQYLGGITSPLFSVSYIKAPEHHFLLFFIAVHNFQSIQTSKLITHQIVHHLSKRRNFNAPQELQRSVRALVYVSFTFTTSLISSDNHLGSSFSHP